MSSTTDEGRLRVLLLGFAGLGPDQDHQQETYLPALSAHEGFEVVGVADTAANAIAERLATKLGVPYTVDWRAAVTADDVDAVSVCVSLDERVEVVTTTLRAGKHVLVDKPMALTADDCAAIADVARETGRVCMPVHHIRLNPMIEAARAALEKGTVGLPWNVQADFLVGNGILASTGELTNFGVYPVDVVNVLTGQPVVEVYARTGRYWDATPGVEDFALLFLTHRYGVTSTISLGRTRALADTEPGAVALHRYRVSGSSGVLEVDATQPSVAVRTGLSSRGAWRGPTTIERVLDEWRSAIDQGRESVPGAADAVEAARVLDAARASLASGSPVRVSVPEQQEGSR